MKGQADDWSQTLVDRSNPAIHRRTRADRRLYAAQIGGTVSRLEPSD